MRARNIKPGFWKNEQLASCDPVARLLFIGLWGIADREGRLKDSPLKIKMELFPCDDLDIEGMLKSLADVGLIERYKVGDGNYIQVVNFVKHQSPHKLERTSTIPPKNGSCRVNIGTSPVNIETSPEKQPELGIEYGTYRVKDGTSHEKNGTSTVLGPKSDIQDSGFRIQGFKEEGCGESIKVEKNPDQAFDRLKSADVAKRIVETYRMDVSSNGMASEARNTVAATLEHDPAATEADLRHAMSSYLADCEAEGTERKYRIGAAKFFAGEWREYLSRDPRSPPQKAITIESVAEINRHEAEVIERLMS